MKRLAAIIRSFWTAKQGTWAQVVRDILLAALLALLIGLILGGLYLAQIMLIPGHSPLDNLLPDE